MSRRRTMIIDNNRPTSTYIASLNNFDSENIEGKRGEIHSSHGLGGNYSHTYPAGRRRRGEIDRAKRRKI